MRIARALLPDVGDFLVRLEGELAVPLARASGEPGADPLRLALVSGLDLHAARAVAASVPLSQCRLGPPVSSPEKLLCIGLNYADHAREAGLPIPSAPLVFAKTANTLLGTGGPIRYRAENSRQVDYEAELAVVIGRPAYQISAEEALDHVFGYTVANDVSARDAQAADGQWVRAKSFDTFCPIGPWIVTPDEVGDVQDLAIRCHVNGQVLQDSSTKEMIFGVDALISYLSQVMTLVPGDVVLTGTPFGVGVARDPQVFLQDGDVVTVEIQRIGAITNPVEVS